MVYFYYTASFVEIQAFFQNIKTEKETHMKKSLSLILVFTALLSSSLAGCSDTADTSSDTTPAATGTAGVETEPADTATYSRDVLPEADFGGATYLSHHGA